MRDAVHFLVLDGLADGQAARALCEIRCPGQWQVQAVGLFLHTAYCEVADAQWSGVPVEGEAGVGCVLRKGSDIPRLLFGADELEAPIVSTRFVSVFAGERLAQGAQAAVLTIEAIRPPARRDVDTSLKVMRGHDAGMDSPPRRGRSLQSQDVRSTACPARVRSPAKDLSAGSRAMSCAVCHPLLSIALAQGPATRRPGRRGRIG